MKCKACRVKFTPVRPMQAACSLECALQVASKVRAKKEAQGRKEAAAERREDRKRLAQFGERGKLMRAAQAAFNAYIRARDRLAGHPCISSGRPLDWSGNAVDAGHYRSVGSAPHLRFDERNVHAQSKHDNQFRAGNVQGYRLGLIERIGLEGVEALEADNSVKKYTVDELREIASTYRQKLKSLVG